MKNNLEEIRESFPVAWFGAISFGSAMRFYNIIPALQQSNEFAHNKELLPHHTFIRGSIVLHCLLDNVS